MRKTKGAALILAAMMVLCSCGKKADTTEKTEAAKEAVTEAETSADTEAASADTEAVTEADTEAAAEAGKNGEYHLVWADEFDGSELNQDDWNYETHEAGWVNHELQEYVPSAEYAYVKDGELVIQPVKKVEEDGTVKYYSGRVNTQNKHDYKYGRFEARIKVPEGKGFLPAFWMMPQDEAFYGQWPKCGEIDIMEVLGNSTNVQYGTLHFGEPHTQRQGTYTLKEGDFSKEYHEFAVEWDPGEIRWYVDGEQFYQTSDWFTALGGAEKPYPAPFNQPFHVILNVAVGGDWPGDPDDSTIFDERAAMYVDYVRIYQRDSYDENVTKPEKVFNDREPDETGNYVNNSSFSEAEDLDDEKDWNFLLFNDGKGEAKIEDGAIVITSTNEGTEEYSVQLVQRDMPLHQGETYKLSFDAKADEDRTIITAVTAPEVDWIRYFPDTKLDVTKDWQTFSYTFEMKEKDDDKGRVEFNLGKQGSTATVYITNVRLEKAE